MATGRRNIQPNSQQENNLQLRTIPRNTTTVSAYFKKKEKLPNTVLKTGPQRNSPFAEHPKKLFKAAAWMEQRQTVLCWHDFQLCVLCVRTMAGSPKHCCLDNATAINKDAAWERQHGLEGIPQQRLGEVPQASESKLLRSAVIILGLAYSQWVLWKEVVCNNFLIFHDQVLRYWVTQLGQVGQDVSRTVLNCPFHGLLNSKDNAQSIANPTTLCVHQQLTHPNITAKQKKWLKSHDTEFRLNNQAVNYFTREYN